MKLHPIGLLGAAAFTAAFAAAQTNNIPQVQHVIIVIQENRSPDNLFGADASAHTQLPGADLATQGNCKGHGQPTLNPYSLDACFDPDHEHNDPADPNATAWVTTYNDGAMDGACTTYYTATQACKTYLPRYPQLTYVDNSKSGVQPYFDIAKQYGFANYMFQTNQGPSFPAHQFLFSGTSAPDYYNDTGSNCGTYPCYQWFVAENHNSDGTYGCAATPAANIYDIAPDGTESLGVYDGGFPCYNHNSMASLLDANGISWKYYPQGPQGPQASTSLWTAPNAIQGICQAALIQEVEGVSQCDGIDWKNNVAPNIPPTTPVTGEMAPILSDIQNCRLPAVSWVIPDGHWSDHPGGCANCKTSGTSGHFLGPAWVADIFNSVGWATNCDTNGYWNDTVILVTWDDWGGWYDHVLPLNCGPSPNGTCSGYSNLTGQQYVYGFRVPLLVVSAYSKTSYISGACGPSWPHSCPNLQAPYVHDFGSILNFIEYAFGTGGDPLYMPAYQPGTGINPQYLYADALAPDAPRTCPGCPYGLSDFFNFSQSPTPFTQIYLPTLLQPYSVTYFENFGLNPGDPAPSDPDNDVVDQ